MKQQQSFVTLQSKNVHFGEPCESGYSTTTSSEEGTLQRGVSHARKQGFASESFLQNPKFLEMVAQGSTRHKKRGKNVHHESPGTPSSQGSPYSSTSSLTQQCVPQYDGTDLAMNSLSRRNQHKNPDMMTSDDLTSRSHENLVDRSGTDELTSSLEDLDIHSNKQQNDLVQAAAIKQFHQSMNQVKSYQSDKFPLPYFTKGNPQVDMDYYKVRDEPRNLYYDPMDISEVSYGQSKKRVVISTSPSSSSGTGSPVKQPSPMRGILKSSKHANSQVSPASTPTRKNSLQSAQQFSKSEENLTSIKNITPPSLSSPLSPGSRKSAFQIVRPRPRNPPTFPEGPVMPMHPLVRQMATQNGRESQCRGYPHTCCHELNDQTLQFQVTPRNSTQVPHPTTLKCTPITNQLHSPQREELPILSNASQSQGDGNIIFIAAKIDENGVASPVVRGFRDQFSFHENRLRHNSDYDLPSEAQAVSNDKANLRDHYKVDQSDRGEVHWHNSHDKDLKSESPLPPAEILSNESVRLRQFLEKVSPEELKKRLQKLLKSKDPGSIHAMAKLFPGSEFTADAAHCVRCHKDFNPREPGRCILPHPERMVAKISQDEIGADFVCGCCNVGFRLIKMDFYEESTNALLTGHCYSGTHTTDPESVDYRIDGGAAKSCEEFGCIEFYV